MDDTVVAITSFFLDYLALGYLGILLLLPTKAIGCESVPRLLVVVVEIRITIHNIYNFGILVLECMTFRCFVIRRFTKLAQLYPTRLCNQHLLHHFLELFQVVSHLINARFQL